MSNLLNKVVFGTPVYIVLDGDVITCYNKDHHLLAQIGVNTYLGLHKEDLTTPPKGGNLVNGVNVKNKE